MDVYNLVLERCAVWKPLVPADPNLDLGHGCYWTLFGVYMHFLLN